MCGCATVFDLQLDDGSSFGWVPVCMFSTNFPSLDVLDAHPVKIYGTWFGRKFSFPKISNRGDCCENGGGKS